MAAASLPRAARSHARSANRPRTHPSTPAHVPEPRDQLPSKSSDVTALKGIVKSRPDPNPLIGVADRLSDVAQILEVAISALDSMVCERTETPKALSMLLDIHGLDPLRQQLKRIAALASKRP
jgi:hypothetical protein